MYKPTHKFYRTSARTTATASQTLLPDNKQYDPKRASENAIFYGTPISKTTGILQRIRTFFWFYPDYLAKLIRRTSPLSYIALYAAILLLGAKSFAYAGQNPNSFFGIPPEQHLIEGSVGSMSTLNPMFVTHNQLDRDLQTLIFNKLIGRASNGNPIPEIASTWAISDDGTEYTFFLRKDIHWHDGKQLTAKDVIFTFQTVQQLEDDDSYASEFADITFTKIDNYTVSMKLPEVNPTLLDSLSFPILPAHILESVRPSAIRYSSFNQYPVGTGPFVITSNTDESVLLVRNNDYFKGTPELESIEYRFFATEEDAVTALKQFQIHTLTQASDDSVFELQGYNAYNAYRFTTLLRQKLVYINMRSTGPLSSANVRHALSAATDRDMLVTTIPSGGVPAYSTIPTASWAYNETADRYSFDGERAKTLLEEAGWTFTDTEGVTSSICIKDGQQLSLVLTYLDSSANTLIAETLQEQWLSLGIGVVLDPQPYERISSETVPRRNFDLLLFEVEYTSDPDRYNLWHSTKSDYPGLNLSGYSNQRVDIILERARTTKDRDKRKSDYAIIDRALMNDMPAIYLYYPSFTFIANNRVNGIELEGATLPQERYNNVQDWYITRSRLGWRNWQTR